MDFFHEDTIIGAWQNVRTNEVMVFDKIGRFDIKVQDQSIYDKNAHLAWEQVGEKLYVTSFDENHKMIRVPLGTFDFKRGHLVIRVPNSVEAFGRCQYTGKMVVLKRIES